ncbi:effector-associated constant component EACC1 [Streptomyces albospinus]|uniref:effector-associated constant component EACC1 n=1 Tax=Streptomyces albospinus TaxID=285515 RepID=UPI00357096A3
MGRECELRGLVKGRGTARPGELGPLADALAVAVGGGGALSELATSLKNHVGQGDRGCSDGRRSPSGELRSDGGRD